MIAMVVHDQNAYAEGVAAARQAIANGVPRWIQTATEPFGPMIHPDNGLPIIGLSAPTTLKEWKESYTEGFNGEILAAIRSGGIEVDFRPLLMTEEEIREALDTFGLGMLAEDNPHIQSPNGDFSMELLQSKAKGKSGRTTWICYSRTSGERWPKFALYEKPVRVALGRDGRVLVFETERLYITRDVATTQVLNRYFR